MQLLVDGAAIAAYPVEFTVTILDLDDANSTERTADGTLNRDRVAVKRQIEMTFNALPWADIAALLTSMSGEFFDFTYPDPMTGVNETKTVYVGNRPAPVAIEIDGVLWWKGLKITLTEQ